MSATYIPLALRRQVIERARGQCEYCLMPEGFTLAPHEVDHIIAEKHGGATTSANLALSCTLCNKHKGSDIASVDPETGEILALYHPRKDQWQDHFQLSHECEIIPLTAKGRVTTQLLQLNRDERVEERRLLVQAGILSLPKQ